MSAPDADAQSSHYDGLDVLHVDMDCFFAAVEALDDPSLQGRPVIVGGIGPRGVVASCSYEARVTGVRSAMPIAQARRRCPEAALIAGRHDRYAEVSQELHEVFQEFTPVVEPVALDEAYLDVSGAHALFGTSLQLAHSIRGRVLEALSLQCSVGVGRSKLIAKLASRAAKPKATPDGIRPGPGVVAVTEPEELGWLWPRPVSDLAGVGPRTAERLTRYGINTVGDLAAFDLDALVRVVGRAAGSQLHALARGCDSRPVVASRPLKSVGHEETFATDRYDPDELSRELVRLSDSVASRLRASGVVGRTVTLKLRFADFSTITRSHSLPGPVLASSEIADLSRALLSAVDISPGVRLIGVTVSSLEPRERSSGRQLSLLGDAADGGPAAGAGPALAPPLAGAARWLPAQQAGDARPVAPARGVPDKTAAYAARGEVDTAVEAIRRRYGLSSVAPAAVMSPKGLRVKRLGDAQWGPEGEEAAGGAGDDVEPGGGPGAP